LYFHTCQNNWNKITLPYFNFLKIFSCYMISYGFLFMIEYFQFLFFFTWTIRQSVFLLDYTNHVWCWHDKTDSYMSRDNQSLWNANRYKRCSDASFNRRQWPIVRAIERAEGVVFKMSPEKSFNEVSFILVFFFFLSWRNHSLTALAGTTITRHLSMFRTVYLSVIPRDVIVSNSKATRDDAINHWVRKKKKKNGTKRQLRVGGFILLLILLPSRRHVRHGTFFEMFCKCSARSTTTTITETVKGAMTTGYLTYGHGGCFMVTRF
jgi:hypothetical protein